jgi:hypothetical protein
MKEADRDRMQRERKEYNRQKGQNQDQSRCESALLTPCAAAKGDDSSSNDNRR